VNWEFCLHFSNESFGSFDERWVESTTDNGFHLSS